MVEATQTEHKLKPHVIWQQGHQPEPCAIVIFGATGDLAQRKIFPTLAHLFHDHPLEKPFCIVAFARRPHSDDDWRNMVLESVNTYLPDDDKLDSEAQQKFAAHLFYCQSDFADQAGYKRLEDLLNHLDKEQGTAGNRLFYMATPPDTDAGVIEQLGIAGLNKPVSEKSWTRIVIEKPFGHDLASAQELNADLGKFFQEDQTFRIDHYMGKETVQNILAFRFANGIFEPLWNQKYIDHVEIVVAESLGIGTRAEFYETSGAIRDIVQNHVMQILCLICMEAPVSYDADAIRDEKVKVLHSIPPMTPEQVAERVVRGQYTAGESEGEPVVGYREEKGVNPNSLTETYVALKLFVENWRWADVPFYIRTGKHLPKRDTEVTIQYKRVPYMLYKAEDIEGLTPNRLILGIQPEESITLKFGAKIPGASRHLGLVDMNFNYSSSFGIESPDAYERLFADCILGDSTLFIRRDEIEASWKIIDPITAAWKQQPADAVKFYQAGTWGPKEAGELIEKDGRVWEIPS
jgi:glucose-6-phosphate 1-dehydrogenase